MGRHLKLKEAALACGIALSLAQMSTAAMAFSPDPAPPQSSNGKGSAPQSGQPSTLQGQVPQPEIKDPLSIVGKQTGTDVTIPGIGSIGTLPKLDFGLELLYGPKSGTDGLQLDQHGQEGDVQIKGTLTHKF